MTILEFLWRLVSGLGMILVVNAIIVLGGLIIMLIPYALIKSENRWHE